MGDGVTVPVTLRLEGAAPLARALRRSPELVAAESLRAMTASLLWVEGDARRNVRHDTRRLMNSITHRVRGQGTRLVGEVGPSLRYGLYVERGRPAGKKAPPKAALRGWARRHGIPESALFVLARAIGREGIKARPFLVPAFTRNADRIVRLFAQAGQRVVVTLGGAS
jgi:hypothetical protein